MHKHVLHVAWHRLPIVLCAESPQALVAQVSVHGIKAFDQHVQPQIEFLFFDQNWGLDVPLY